MTGTPRDRAAAIAARSAGWRTRNDSSSFSPSGCWKSVITSITTSASRTSSRRSFLGDERRPSRRFTGETHVRGARGRYRRACMLGRLTHSQSEVISERGVVSAGHAAEAEAGVRVFAEGGNAMDAVIAAAFVGFVV